ncbi:MAG TPA: haloacid dehalogenase-like hydrolase [Candidatus Krumholzibacteria bacterium]|nr:haloacid dehalogenase-like hydrolase [Candidatus Krumholzibacteria bacterium]HPD70351.1 haloacid dehalogenase-like hydrolase [Candidatus Krumholzibacteria bacterium]HRY39949.1 haloacid dehalogenase-like hydrolase [Candidatus Krumholzibacteria bacterium]
MPRRVSVLASLVVLAAVLGHTGCAAPGDATVATGAADTAGAADPLPSWRDGAAKAAIVEYLDAVTDPAGPDFVPVAERIAVVDNDGTLWCEQPADPSTLFQVSLLRSLAREGRIDADEMPLSAWLAGDDDALRRHGMSDAYAALNAAFAGLPVAAYRDSVRSFLARARHPEFGVPYPDLYYLPMLDLVRLLELRRFQVWVSTGAEQDFVRAYLEPVTGLPPERLIGTWTTPVYSVADDGAVAMIRGAARTYNGREHKPVNIETRIGRRPIFAAGNSDNDEPMCRWTLAGERRALALWIDHDDAEREYLADGGVDRIAALCREHPAAIAVSMRRDWVRVFAAR